MLFTIFSIAWASLSLAQIEPGKAQPDRVEFGTIRIGGIADASVRIFAPGNDAEGVKTKVTAPPFVIIKDSNLGTQTYGNKGTWLVFDVFLSISTRTASNLTGEIKVQIANQETVVPVHAFVASNAPGLTRALIVASPFGRYSTENADSFSAWLRVVEDGKLDPWYLEGGSDGSVLRNLPLKNFDVVMMAEAGLVEMQDKDVNSLVQFVETGGRVVLCANAFYGRTIEKANKVLTRFGLEMQNQEPRVPGAEIATGKDIVEDMLTREVKALVFSRASPIAITDSKKGKILVRAQTYGGLGYVAVSRPGPGQGEVIALGQSLWWNWIADLNNNPRENGRLLQNLLSKPRTK